MSESAPAVDVAEKLGREGVILLTDDKERFTHNPMGSLEDFWHNNYMAHNMLVLPGLDMMLHLSPSDTKREVFILREEKPVSNDGPNEIIFSFVSGEKGETIRKSSEARTATIKFARHLGPTTHAYFNLPNQKGGHSISEMSKDPAELNALGRFHGHIMGLLK